MAHSYFTWAAPNPVPAEINISGGDWQELATNMRLIRGYQSDFSAAWAGASVSLGSAGAYTASPYDFYVQDPNFGATDTPPRAEHMNDLRVALDNVNASWAAIRSGWSWCQQYSNSDSAYPNARVIVGSTKVRATHINELRQQLDLVATSMATSSPFCPTACQVGCQLVCQTSCQYACQGCNNGTCHDQMCGAW